MNRIERRYRGKEIAEIHPVVLGGHPTDPKNKVALGREEHVQYVNYWNGIIRNLRKEAERPV